MNGGFPTSGLFLFLLRIMSGFWIHWGGHFGHFEAG
jgi:hypothetical protein